MAKRWVLSTETKGTGAEMVPLDKAHDGSGPRAPVIVKPPRPVPEKPPEPIGPRRFKVVDVMTRQVLSEDAGTRATVPRGHPQRRRRERLRLGQEGRRLATALAA
jgi:hypothetical protein